MIAVDESKIKVLRKQEKLTQQELGKLVHTTQTMVHYIENGIKPPSVELLGRIAGFFGCKVDNLLLKRVHSRRPLLPLGVAL